MTNATQRRLSALEKRHGHRSTAGLAAADLTDAELWAIVFAGTGADVADLSDEELLKIADDGEVTA